VADLYRLEQIQPEHRSLVGNKAFYLSQLLQKGYPVIPGFVISARLTQKFLQTVDWSNPLFADLPDSSLRLDVEDSRQLQAIARQIRHIIRATPLPQEWLDTVKAAVEELGAATVVLRPSLGFQPDIRTETFARTNPVLNGKSSAIFNTHVRVAEASEIIQSIQQIWAELFGARSLFYWQRSGVPLQRLRLAVLIQSLQPAVAAGTLCTDSATIEIRSTLGLGITLSRGEVVPDIHQYDARTGKLWAQQLGRKTLSCQVRSSYASATGIQTGGTDLVLPDAMHLPLDLAIVDEAEQAHYSLNSGQLEELINLSQSLINDLGFNQELEWVICHEPTGQTKLWLTQATPVHPTPIQRLEATVTQQNSSDSPAPQSTNLPPGELLVTGLGAAAGRAIAPVSIITDPDTPPDSIPVGTVLVAPFLPPHWLPLIQQAAAIVTEQGGRTSHSAILAREMNIPAVMGATGATGQIQAGDRVLVDGFLGKVYRVTREQTLFRREARIGAIVPPDRPPLGTRLMVNLSQITSLPQITELPVDGVGLLRSELLLVPLLERQHPQHWLEQGRSRELVQRLAGALQTFAAALAPRPVFYRSLDMRSHEFRGLVGGERTGLEPNPILGVRGTYSYVRNPALFDLELAALRRVQEAGYENIRLLLPFVRTVEEFCYCRQRLDQSGLFRSSYFQVWIMAEVPSVLFLLPEYVSQGVQGISIGTNDLTQLLLAVDRDYEPTLPLFDERHPAVTAAISHLIQQSQSLGIPCSICGQTPVHHPELIEDLVRWGITSISVEPEAVEITYRAIARAERNLFLEKGRQQTGEEGGGGI
jgi:pyruvate,water dikinase